nr:hypothetical protein CTI12_AA402100 [Tanacetum cinerariifolium]
IKLSIEGLAECKASASNKDSLGAKRQRAVKDSLSAKPQRASQSYSSQRHRQESRRLLEDILVSWDGYQLIKLNFSFSIATVVNMFIPSILTFAVNDIPLLYSTILLWLRPLYVFVIINTLIITIPATSCFHHHTNYNEVQSQPLDHLPPVIVPPMIVYENVNTLPEVSTVVYEVENPIIDDEPVVVEDKEVETDFVFSGREKPLAGSRFVGQRKLTAKVNPE